MSRRRFIADEVSGDRAVLAGAHAAHLARVLRARAGQEFEIAAAGRVRLGRILEVSDDRVLFELGEDMPARDGTPITIWLAVFKFDRMEWAIEKCTELGAARMVPLIASRTDAHLASAAAKRSERWRRIALQASEQSRRAAPPVIENAIRLKADILQSEFLKQENAAKRSSALRILLAETEHRLSLLDALTGCDFGAAAASEIHLAVGPEGGWTSAELKIFTDAGWVAASLGPAILRAETAAIAALAIARAYSSQSKTE